MYLSIFGESYTIIAIWNRGIRFDNSFSIEINHFFKKMRLRIFTLIFISNFTIYFYIKISNIYPLWWNPVTPCIFSILVCRVFMTILFERGIRFVNSFSIEINHSFKKMRFMFFYPLFLSVILLYIFIIKISNIYPLWWNPVTPCIYLFVGGDQCYP